MLKQLTIIFLLLISSQLMGMENEIQETFYNHSWGVGLNYRNWNYHEYSDDGSIFMKEDGDLPGFRLSYLKPFTLSNWLFEVDIDTISGNTKYDGSLQDGTPYQMVSTNSILMFKVIWGKAYGNSSFSYTPYFGLAGRSTDNPELASSANDYSRMISYTYLPVGIKTMYSFNLKSFVALNFQYNLFIGGDVETSLSDADPGLPDFTVEQEEGKGYEMDLSYTYHLFEKFSVKISAYYQYWKIEDSSIASFNSFDKDGNAVIMSFLEPKNTTKTQGITFSLLY